MCSWLGGGLGGALARALGGALALAAITASSIASAQDRRFVPKFQGHRLGTELDVWSTSALSTVTGSFIGQFAVVPQLIVDFEFPSAYGTIDAPGYSTFLLGN